MRPACASSCWSGRRRSSDCGTNYALSVTHATGSDSKPPVFVSGRAANVSPSVFPEILKIIDGAVRHDPRQAAAYAERLAGKLEAAGAVKPAARIRSELARSTAGVVASSGADSVPRDEAGNVALVDRPGLASRDLVLSERIARRVEEFVSLAERVDVLMDAGLPVPTRLLLHGPPGTGKTSIAALVADRLRLPLLVSRSDALVSSLLGQTSRNLRAVFEHAARYPCVLFLDEFDALAKDRADSREVGELQRVVIALLQNLDALGDSTYVIAATNHPELLDDAVWRRFHYVIETRLPSLSERQKIWARSLRPVRASERQLHALALASQGQSGADVAASAVDIAQQCVVRGRDDLDLAFALRRLWHRMWYQTSSATDDVSSEIRALREWMPSIFTIRALASEFGISTRQVTKALGESDAGGD